MILKFDTWKTFEDFGTGIETFTARIQVYGIEGDDTNNLSFYKDPFEEIVNARGTVTYKLELNYRNDPKKLSKNGLRDIVFSLEKIQFVVVVDQDDVVTGETIEKSYNIDIDKDSIDPNNVKIDIGLFPLDLEEFEIDFEHVKLENLQDKEQLRKLKYDVKLGK